jgi:hypothetical protein
MRCQVQGQVYFTFLLCGPAKGRVYGVGPEVHVFWSAAVVRRVGDAFQRGVKLRERYAQSRLVLRFISSCGLSVKR